MDRFKAISLERVKTVELTRLLAFVGVAMFLPFVVHIQWLTGPIINAIFLIVLFLSGIKEAMLVALIPSLMALSGGLLPMVLAPIIPFIMVSNIIYIYAMHITNNRIGNNTKAFIIGVVIASSVKFLFLFSTTSIMTKLIMKQALVAKVAQMMSWPQLFTALAGGVIAFIVLKWLKRI